jgi:hypothetical protein
VLQSQQTDSAAIPALLAVIAAGCKISAVSEEELPGYSRAIFENQYRVFGEKLEHTLI